MTTGSSIFGERAQRALDAADRNRFLILSAVGYGLCCYAASCFPSDIKGMASADALSNISKVIGVAVFVAFSVAIDRKSHNRVLFFVPSCFSLVGCVALAVFELASISAPQLEAVALCLASAGTACAMLQWLELIALSPLRGIALAIAGAETLCSVGVLALGQAPLAAFALAMPISCCLFVICRRGWELTPGRAPQSAPRLMSPLRKLIPWSIVIWVALLSAAYGYVVSSTGSVLMSRANDVGNVLPCAAILLLALVLPQRFDLNLLKGMALAFMAVGLLLASWGGIDAAPTQVFASAGAASCRLFAYAMACMHAHGRGVSALPSCAVVKLAIILASWAGMEAAALSIAQQTGAYVIALLAGLVGLSGAFFSPMTHSRSIESGSSSSNSSNLSEPFEENPADMRERLARAAGLTERETDVFELMAQGLTTAQICSELFVTKSTVRAHQSRIYGKLDVHSHQEFMDLLARQTAQGQGLEKPR